MTHSTWEALPRPIGEPSSSSDQEQSGYLAPVLSAVDAGDLPQHTLEPRRPGLHEETVEEEGDDNIFSRYFKGEGANLLSLNLWAMKRPITATLKDTGITMKNGGAM